MDWPFDMSRDLQRRPVVKSDPFATSSSVAKADNVAPLAAMAPVTVRLLVEKAAPADRPHEVLGVVLEPLKEFGEADTQGDTYSAEEVELACRRYNRKLALEGQGDKAGSQHSKNPRWTTDDVLIVESYVAPADMTIEGEPVRKGTWLMRWEILNDALWQAIERGDVTGFSIGGTAEEYPLR